MNVCVAQPLPPDYIPTLSLHSIGTEAYAICQQYEDRTGIQVSVVTTVFDRSAYISIGQKLVCIVMHELGASPLSLQLSPAITRLPLLNVGDAVAVSHKTQSLQLGMQASIDLRSGSHFSGVVTDLPVRAPCTRISLMIRACLPASDHGLYACIVHKQMPADNTTGWYLYQQVKPAVELLREWLAVQFTATPSSPPPAEISALVGAGPGLTPSGDDVLCGVLCALHMLGKAHAANALWTQLQPALTTGTNAISAAFLQQASRARANNACLSALRAVVSTVADATACAVTNPAGNAIANSHANSSVNRIGNDVETVQVTVAKISAWLDSVGQSSGWDFFAGACLVFEAGGVNWK